jgi:arylsulfatase
MRLFSGRVQAMQGKLDINRRDLLAAAGAAGAASLLGTQAASAAGAPAPKPRGPRKRAPNILLVVNDQERSFADMPSRLPLPGHDWVRARGVSFDNYHVNTSPCSPSRSVMYTGQHTQHTGVFFNTNSPPTFPQLKPEMPTIGTMLREAGYYTAYKGKWHVSNLNDKLKFHAIAVGDWPDARDVLEPYGFADYNFNGERVGLTWEGFMDDATTAAEAVNQLDAFKNGKAGDKPWFLAVNFVNPHDIMWYDATGQGEETRMRPNFISPIMAAPGDPVYAPDWKEPLPKSFYLDDLSTKPSVQRAITALQWAFFGKLPHADEAAWTKFQNYYFNCICDADRHMKTVFDALARNGQLEDTIVIFTSDHGERGSAHGMRQKAGTIYKEDIRVPFVVAHPDVKGGRATAALGSTVDLAPTILSLAGVPQARIAEKYPVLKGHDLSPAVSDAAARTTRDKDGILFNYAVRAYWNAPDPAKGEVYTKPLPKEDLMLRRLFRGVHDGRYKFARYFAPAQHHTPVTWQQLTTYNDLELYDTKADPDEIVNLAHTPEKYRAEILRLNAMTNALVAREVGTDDGSEYPGPLSQYNTLKL